MRLIRNAMTKQVACYWEDGQGEALAEPTPFEGQEVVHMPETTVVDFERAAAESFGVAESPGGDGTIGPMFVHDSVPAATRSQATQGRGIKLGNSKHAVEADPPGDPRTLADEIIEARRKGGRDLDAPVSLGELREADLIRLRRGQFTPPARGG